MSGSYSFVLTDMHMPVMSGIEMMRTVLVRRNRLPAVVVWVIVVMIVLCGCPNGIVGVKRTLAHTHIQSHTFPRRHVSNRHEPQTTRQHGRHWIAPMS